MIARRNRMTARARETAAEKIAQRLIWCNELFGLSRIGLYWGFKGEIATREIFQTLRYAGKKIYFPRVLRKKNELEFVEIDEEKQFVRGFYGLLEPDPYLPATKTDELEIIIAPGLAFDPQGHRIGWGKGFYDRALKKYKGKRWALAYDFQVLSQVPAERRDQPVEVIVTDRRIIRCSPVRPKTFFHR